jgi:redox-sensing transcriptional repressor
MHRKGVQYKSLQCGQKGGIDLNSEKISPAVLSRIPVYLSFLKSLSGTIPENISATRIANALGQGEVQVRKDLARVTSGGRPKTGYPTKELTETLETFLGYKDVDNAIIVGAGKLGQALLNYDGFSHVGLNIVAAFDIAGTEPSSDSRHIFPLSQLPDVCAKHQVKIGIITVPASQAQGVCDELVDAGILAIMNFAPTHLSVPSTVLLENENIAASLALLSQRVTRAIDRR